MNAELLSRIKAHEGLKTVVYDDATGKAIMPGDTVKGNPTIGYGTLLCAPGGLTQDECEQLFANRVAKA